MQCIDHRSVVVSASSAKKKKKAKNRHHAVRAVIPMGTHSNNETVRGSKGKGGPRRFTTHSS